MWTNFVLTAVALGSVVYLMKSDVRTGATTLRRNMKVIRGWMEEQGAAAQQASKQEVKQVGERTSASVKAAEKEPASVKAPEKEPPAPP